MENFISSAWSVFLLFTIPVGGGIPAGVLLARNKGIPWPGMLLLYFLSDLVLACVFEPIMRGLVLASKRSKILTQMGAALQQSISKTTSHYGSHLGPFALVLVAFGVDPMTGRIAAAAAGHGFISGWAIAITGDLFYFLLIMSSTLWLGGILGDEVQTTLIILILMMILPMLIKKIRGRWRAATQKSV
jgi:hypothetical protein